ncbi:Six-hairpin glycosidase-like protein [Globomyces pollinis-pini]|nr:Six-hairpin glycosidase-like protein [Globomyces pollinis-pini]
MRKSPINEPDIEMTTSPSEQPKRAPWGVTSSTQDSSHLEIELSYPDRDFAVAHGQTRKRTQSILQPPLMQPTKRRASLNPPTGKSTSYLIEVEKTLAKLLEQEDTDRNGQITILDAGPKAFTLGTADSGGFKKVQIRGTYCLSNLLQELAIASELGRSTIVLDDERLNENPLERLSRLIKYNFWDGLTRRMDANGLEKICADPKNRTPDQRHRVYVPYFDKFALDYYQKIANERKHLNLMVVQLPENITPEYVKSINNAPGILSLGLRQEINPVTGVTEVKGTPFVVPGGRFNEMYGWDSYFEALGLLQDGRVELARGMVENFWYEIEHYHKILNANRSYYLTRSQPPFLTDMTIQTHKALTSKFTVKQSEEWMAKGMKAAVKELLSVWLCHPRLDKITGLVKYHPEGIGMPPETESSHFDHILQPFADSYNLDIETFGKKYQSGEIHVPALDSYFIHDRAVRESGHDTTYRFEKRCANLATIDLNSLVYKYERDLEMLIKEHGFFNKIKLQVRRGPNDELLTEFLVWATAYKNHGVNYMLRNGMWDTKWAIGIFLTNNVHYELSCLSLSDIGYELPFQSEDFFTVYLPSQLFKELGDTHRELINEYLWCDETNLYFDYDCSIRLRSVYKTCTAFWALWAEIPTPDRAEKLVRSCLKHFKEVGGLVSGTEESRGHITIERPNRQWDYPYGWAPHQILAWTGLSNYNYHNECTEIVYRWLYSITKSFVDFNGVVPEKFDVVNVSHLVQVEYGNVGVDFKYVVKEGFGWMNASYQIGLPLLSTKHKRLLANLTHPDLVFITGTTNST